MPSSSPTFRRLAGALRRIAHVPRLLLIGLVRLYQLVLAPHLPDSCRYTPTCSQYAVEAFRTYGAAKGLVLTTWRLLRCAPWGGRGYDPPRWFGEHVPEAEHVSRTEHVSEVEHVHLREHVSTPEQVKAEARVPEAEHIL